MELSIAGQLNKIKQSLPPQVELVVVTKTHPVEKIQEVLDAGHAVFGENRVQEMVDKAAQLPDTVQWHLIGHLQTNKIKYIAAFVHLIHSVDSLYLLQEINRHAERHKRTINCLLQVYIAKEETKFGLSAEELNELLISDEFAELRHVRVIGLMGMASNVADEGIVRDEFKQLKKLFDSCKMELSQAADWKTLSMGMSSDYRVAIEEGSTLVRIGSAIFGNR